MAIQTISDTLRAARPLGPNNLSDHPSSSSTAYALKIATFSGGQKIK
jgi:hypothetical protein